MKKKKLKRYSKFQKVKNALLLFFRDLHTSIKYGRTFILDTNFLVRRASESSDKRYRKNLFHFSTILTTETVIKEKDLLLTTGRYSYIGPSRELEVLSFEEIRKDIPYLCPLYYNFLSWMHNPASFMSDDFHLHALLKEDVIDGEKISDRHVWDRLINHFTKSREIRSEELEDNPSLDDEWVVMCKSALGANRKKRKAIKKDDQHYFNDLKLVALSLFYTLDKKRNVTILTADSDFINLVFTLWGSFANEQSFKTEILEKINNDKISFSGKNVEINLNAISLYKKKEGLIRDVFADNWKRDYVIFKLKYWDQNRNKYFTFTFRINEVIRALLLNSWGNYFCPFAQDPRMGNWLGFKWYEPHPKDLVNGLGGVEVKVEMWKKYRWPVCSYVDKGIHEEVCLYPKMDKECNYGFFSQFAKERQ